MSYSLRNRLLQRNPDPFFATHRAPWSAFDQACARGFVPVVNEAERGDRRCSIDRCGGRVGRRNDGQQGIGRERTTPMSHRRARGFARPSHGLAHALHARVQSKCTPVRVRGGVITPELEMIVTQARGRAEMIRIQLERTVACEQRVLVSLGQVIQHCTLVPRFSEFRMRDQDLVKKALRGRPRRQSHALQRRAQ